MCSKKEISPREQEIRAKLEELKKYAKEEEEYIQFLVFGKDKHKKKKNNQDCDRGTRSCVARQCSKHIRTIFTTNIIGDNQQSEWCVVSRNKQMNNNKCTLCGINPNQFASTPNINIAKAICNELDGNNSSHNLQRRLESFMLFHIGTDYPSNKKNTILRIKINGTKWIEYYIKLTAFSSMLRASAPSGYKYKDRISLGDNIRIQGNNNKDLIFCIMKDEEEKIDEKMEEQQPVVNMVGFWNLHKNGGIRNIIQLNHCQALNVCFKFLINPYATNIKTIDVELDCTAYSMKNTVVTLWRYSRGNNNREHMPQPMQYNDGYIEGDYMDRSTTMTPMPFCDDIATNTNNFQTEPNVEGIAHSMRGNNNVDHVHNDNYIHNDVYIDINNDDDHRADTSSISLPSQQQSTSPINSIVATRKRHIFYGKGMNDEDIDFCDDDEMMMVDGDGVHVQRRPILAEAINNEIEVNLVAANNDNQQLQPQPHNNNDAIFAPKITNIPKGKFYASQPSISSMRSNNNNNDHVYNGDYIEIKDDDEHRADTASISLPSQQSTSPMDFSSFPSMHMPLPVHSNHLQHYAVNNQSEQPIVPQHHPFPPFPPFLQCSEHHITNNNHITSSMPPPGISSNINYNNEFQDNATIFSQQPLNLYNNSCSLPPAIPSIFNDDLSNFNCNENMNNIIFNDNNQPQRKKRRFE